MENYDPISSDEIRIEKRIAFLEHRVRNFRIAVSGGADVMGGFGKLPFADQIPDRIANLEWAFSQFNLQGSGVSAFGSIEKGYNLTA